ncbi:MAG: hypothetical protein OEZ14_09995 [Acidimicrobiia bacterium]|nr:hypothetical protein [Acidimicrobiia bacterium]MDH5520848.1 hypothetical protein [Acidimicrobiia bacterium]
MTTFSGDADGERLCCCPTADVDRHTTAEPELAELLHRFRQRIDGIRAADPKTAPLPSGPADLALTVVAEALAIGEAMSRLAIDIPADGAENQRSPAIYAEIDSRFVEHRARALRSALYGVDDYVWWGGLATTAG